MLVNSEVLEDLYENAGASRRQRAIEYQLMGYVKITKVLYENPSNMEIYSNVRGSSDIYHVYVKVANGELDDVTCTCPDYERSYGACKHIVATMLEFTKNKEYQNIFEKKEQRENVEENHIARNFEDEKNYAFRQLVGAFYSVDNNEDVEQIESKIPLHSIKIEPKIIYHQYSKDMKLEFKIGYKQLYKLKNLTEFYDRMLNKENFKYGAKLEFVHQEEAFEKDSIPLLKYILKYAEIIKYTNESLNGYNYYGSSLRDGYITVSNSGMDELFDVLKNKQVEFETEISNKVVLFSENEPNIKFEIVEEDKGEYVLKPKGFDVFKYEIFKGRQYTYMLYKKAIYRCSKDFEDTTLKLLEIFRENYTSEIKFHKKDMENMFSVVYPRIKDKIEIQEMPNEDIEKYVPKDLFVKVFLDVNEENFITADLKFVYGETEFNPLLKETVNVARDIGGENSVLNMFLKSGFMLDRNSNRLILVKDDLIYEFLSTDIEEYMKKFEVLATDSFKKREIRQPKAESLGVRIENNLLNIDFSKLDFDLSELADVMEKYKLKKKYHRLKDGSFLSLEQNETMDFLEGITEDIDVDYNKIQKGELHLPVYRSMYLDRLLKNFDQSTINKNDEYNKFIKNIDKKEIDEEVTMPKELNADLRSYQKVGFEWLSLLDKYQLGGILADDMGLGKTLQMLAVILAYVENAQKPKASIVVCPSSLTLNWLNEACKFAPSLKAMVIHGNSQERKEQIHNIDNYNLVITSYDLLKRDLDEYIELDYNFQYIIADEAQYIKNNNTQNAKAIKEIHAKTRYALTGTPIENSLSELWSIFDFIMPGYLFRYKKFKDLYEVPIAKDNNEESMARLKMLIEPFVLRRIKKDVLTELPDKTITVLNNEMQGEQLKIYASYMAQARQEAKDEIIQNGFEKSQIKILALLMRLRQICCHPSLFLQDYTGESSKLTQCIEVMKDAVQAGHKILLFSGYTSMFEIIEKELKKEGIEYFKLTGQTKVGDRIRLVDEFNQNENIKVFLISLKAGGTGLNLVGADMVIHYDPWWNLSAENQATDRTYRIGQKKNVQVYKLITKNSIEEKIYELQQRKAELADNMLSTQQTFISKLSKDDIMALFE